MFACDAQSRTLICPFPHPAVSTVRPRLALHPNANHFCVELTPLGNLGIISFAEYEDFALMGRR